MSNELYHYGVKGMKWGVRKANRGIDRGIDRISTARKQNKLEYQLWNREAKSRYSGKKLNKELAYNKAMYDSTETSNRYLLARNQAKKDKSYKNTDEYKSIKKEYSKMKTQSYVYGPNGHIRIESLKNQGYSERQAKAKTFVETLASAALSATLEAAVRVI